MLCLQVVQLGHSVVLRVTLDSMFYMLLNNYFII